MGQVHEGKILFFFLKNMKIVRNILKNKKCVTKKKLSRPQKVGLGSVGFLETKHFFFA